MFNSNEEKKYINEMHKKIEQLEKQTESFNNSKASIQQKFDFTLPDYIIDAILENDYENLCALINCAVLNGSLSKENGEKVKQEYK